MSCSGKPDAQQLQGNKLLFALRQAQCPVSTQELHFRMLQDKVYSDGATWQGTKILMP